MYKPTVQEALNLHTGEPIRSEAFFQQPERILFQERRRNEEFRREANPLYVCAYCNQPLVIRGHPGGTPTMHFKHPVHSGDCPWKTPDRYTPEEMLRMKYNGAKESQLHQHMKSWIAASLQSDPTFSEIYPEKVVKHKGISKEWRKPDIQAQYQQQPVVFEIQLSTTFLSVIVARDLFYKQNQTFILWIFNKFYEDFDEQRFTEKDILYANRNNIFVVNETTCERSQQEQNFVLLCYYLEPYLEEAQIHHRWRHKYIRFQELTLDYSNYRTYFYDSHAAYQRYEIQRKTKLLEEAFHQELPIILQALQQEHQQKLQQYEGEYQEIQQQLEQHKQSLPQVSKQLTARQENLTVLLAEKEPPYEVLDETYHQFLKYRKLVFPKHIPPQVAKIIYDFLDNEKKDLLTDLPFFVNASEEERLQRIASKLYILYEGLKGYWAEKVQEIQAQLNQKQEEYQVLLQNTEQLQQQKQVIEATIEAEKQTFPQQLESVTLEKHTQLEQTKQQLLHRE